MRPTEYIVQVEFLHRDPQDVISITLFDMDMAMTTAASFDLSMLGNINIVENSYHGNDEIAFIGGTKLMYGMAEIAVCQNQLKHAHDVHKLKAVLADMDPAELGADHTGLVLYGPSAHGVSHGLGVVPKQVLIVSDYSSLEARVMEHVAGDEAVIPYRHPQFDQIPKPVQVVTKPKKRIRADWKKNPYRG